jgi:four helix bundle protein
MLADVTAQSRQDPLFRMAAYQLATEALAAAADDAIVLLRRSPGRAVADQLYRAVGSVGANIAEGYSRSSGRDRVRLFEYALGSARESLHWYRAAAPFLDPHRIEQQDERLSRVRRILLTAIPQERNRTIRPDTER